MVYGYITDMMKAPSNGEKNNLHSEAFFENNLSSSIDGNLRGPPPNATPQRDKALLRDY